MIYKAPTSIKNQGALGVGGHRGYYYIIYLIIVDQNNSQRISLDEP